MKFEKVRPGMALYDVHRHKMGNTTLSTVGVWTVVVESVDAEKRAVIARWNGNPARTYYEGAVSKWREKPPLLIRGRMGPRLATREEIKAARLAEAQKPAPAASGSAEEHSVK